MIRVTIDIDGDDTLATKEAVAMRMESLGRVRIVKVVSAGAGTYRITVDVEGDESRVTKRVVTMLLAPIGNVGNVSVIVNGKDKP